VHPEVVGRIPALDYGLRRQSAAATGALGMEMS